MMLSKLLTTFSSKVMQAASSGLLLAEKKALAEAFSIENIAGIIISFVGELVYFAAKWILYFVDILFFYIQELSGLNMDTSSLEAMVSKDSDMIFRLLQTETIDISKIVRRLIGLTIILIIVFSAIAIVRNQYNAIKEGKVGDSPMTVISSAFKSLMVLIVTPIIAIIGIVASNLLLKSLYNATNVSGASSLGTKIFSVSSTSANLYRQYATDGKRIPITFDFSKEEEILESYKNAVITTKMAEYLTSTENAIYATYLMFNGKDFTGFDKLTTSSTTDLTNYHKLYDTLVNAETNELAQYKKIRAYREEYFVMADAIDYAITTSTVMYFKTLEEVLDSILELPETEGKDVMEDLTNEFGIKMGTPAAVNDLTYTAYENKAGTWNILRFTSNYFGIDESGRASKKEQIQYNHVRGATDESSGAVYLMTVEKQLVDSEGVTRTYLYPLTVGYSKTGGGRGFESEYISRNQIIAAKGIFNEDKYPTAIRKSADGSEIQFYRDTLETITLGDSGKILTTEFVEEEEEQSGVMGAINAVVKFIKKLFDPSQWLPDFKLSEDAVMTSYAKVTKQTNSLAEGKLSIGYLFSDNVTSALSGGIYGLKLYNLFNPLNLNYMVLTAGAFLMAKMCFLAIFALIKRMYDLFMIIIIYPITCATMPFDNGTSYGSWMKKYTEKLFLAYGLILGINFIFMLFPAIEKIELFDAELLVTNKIVARISSMFAWLLTYEQQAKILNLAMAILFELVLFTYIESGSGKGKSKSESIVNVITRIVDPNNKNESLYAENPAAKMAHTAIQATKAVSTATGYGAAAVKFIFTKNKMEKFKEKMKEHAPGKQLKDDIEKKRALKEQKRERDEAMHDLKNSMTDGSSAEDIEKKLNRVQGKKEKKPPTPPPSPPPPTPPPS